MNARTSRFTRPGLATPRDAPVAGKAEDSVHSAALHPQELAAPVPVGTPSVRAPSRFSRPRPSPQGNMASQGTGHDGGGVEAGDNAHDGGTDKDSLPVLLAPAVPAELDAFRLPGFVLVQGAPRPPRVSPHVWDAIMPPDRARVLTLAGRHFMGGKTPDHAVALAMRDIEGVRWKSADFAPILSRLAPAFDADPGDVPPKPALACACDGVLTTARAAWWPLQTAQDPVRMSFLLRRWRARTDCCLVCALPALPGDTRYKAREYTDAGDAVHAGCAGAIKTIGPIFGQLVVEQAGAIASISDPPVVLPRWDQDPAVDHAIYGDVDLSTWSAGDGDATVAAHS